MEFYAVFLSNRLKMLKEAAGQMWSAYHDLPTLLALENNYLPFIEVQEW